MRLIDADTIEYVSLYKENFMQGTGKEEPAVWKADIDAMPTVDAEPVIRCQNCKHNKTFKCPLYTEHYSASYGYSVESRNAPDDFCSRAERKEE